MTYRLLGYREGSELEEVLWEDSREENCAYVLEMELGRGAREMRIVSVTVPESSAKVEPPEKKVLYGVFVNGTGNCVYLQKECYTTLEDAQKMARQKASASDFPHGVVKLGDVL